MKKFLFKLAEQYVDRFYEGLQAPPRIAATILEFKRSHPNATPDQWEAFATAFAGRSWREGFVRGFENAERDPKLRDQWKRLPPDAIADREHPDWRESPAFDPERSPEEAVDEVGTSLDAMMVGRTRL